MEDNLQPALFDNLPPITAPEYETGESIRQRWWRFHCANLHVYSLLRTMALDLKRKGFKKGSVALFFEKLRWEYYIQTRGDEEYRLNNSYRALYARLLMARESELEGFFETRVRRSEPGQAPE